MAAALRTLVWSAVALASAIVVTVGAAAAATLDEVRDRGTLRCGVVAGPSGLAVEPDGAGGWRGFDADLCRAVAAAVFGDPWMLSIVALDAAQPLAALTAGEVDVVARHGAGAGDIGDAAAVRSAALAFMDGLGLMAPADPGLLNLRELAGRRVCYVEDADTRGRLDDLARRLQITVAFAPLPDLGSARTALGDGRCDLLAAGRVDLATVRAASAGALDAYEIRPDLLSKSPAGPVVRADDPAWLDLVRWTLFALIEAEERGITTDTVEQERATSGDPAVQRFLGASGAIGASLGLDADWVVRIIATAGNYGEIYDRNLGSGSTLALPRGPNALWKDGGLLQAMPFQ